MTIQNFTARDIAATSLAVLLFSLFTVIPGYVVASLLKLFSFESRSLPARFAIAISLSIAVVPILLYLNWRFVPQAPWLLCAVSWAMVPAIVVRRAHWRNAARGPLSKERRVVLAILAGWVVLGTLCMVDLQIGHRLYFHLASFDYTLRSAFTAAIARTGVPPVNPFYYPGHAYVMRYHYFWYMVCALVDRFGAGVVTGRIAVIAGTLWIGVALAAVISLFAQRFGAETSIGRDRQMLIGIALLSVSGLDIVPTVITILLSKRPPASTDWWNELMLSWLNSVVWQPHSVAALIACATGLLVSWEGAKRGRGMRIAGAAVSGAAFASAVGLSVYVAFVFAVGLAVWLAILMLRKRWADAGTYCAAAVFALLLSIPYVAELLRGGTSGSQWPIALTVRRFYIVELMVEAVGGARWQVIIANALTLPLNYFLEFGVFFVAGMYQWRRLRKQCRYTDADLLCIVMLTSSLIVCSFLRSTAIANNDLGWRGMILAQFVLLLWAAELWDISLFPAGRTWLSTVGVMVVLGATATVYDVAMMRVYPMLLDDFAMPRYHWLAPDQKLGERTYALRQTYEMLNKMLPSDAIVQQTPNRNPGDLFYGLYADRQAAAESPGCGAVFGGPADLCTSTLEQIDEIFSPSTPLTYPQVEDICRKLSIHAVVIKDTDGVWQNRNSWIWKAEPAISNSYARTFLCGAMRK